MTITTAPLPLAGIKVVEFAQNLAGPYAGEILASLGADVLKVERPDGGDDARGWGPPFYQGAASSFHAVNYNKRSVALDLKDPKDITWIKNYLLQADVLVQNLRPGVLEGMGLDSDTLLAANPRLVYCSLRAFGRDGPMKLHPGYEPMIQAFSGIFNLSGDPTSPSSRVGMPILDLGTGVWTALGCIAALFRRFQTGRGGVVDTSLFETALGWQSVHLATFGITGKPPERHRTGSAKLIVFQSFETRDGEVVVAAANDRLFAKLVTAIGRPQWAKDVRFATNALRVENRSSLMPEMESIFKSETTEHWVTCLESMGVPCAPINTMSAVFEHPQTLATGMLNAAPGHELKLVGLPVSFDGMRPPVRHMAPEIGAHNHEVGLPVVKKPE